MDALEKAIGAALGGKKPVPSKVKELSGLELGRIDSLEGLAAYTALERLEIRGGMLPDLSPLARLPKLAELTLARGTRAKRLAGLSGARALARMQLSAAGVPLALLAEVELPALRELVVYSGKIGRPTWLGGLGGLRNLTLKANTARSDLADLGQVGTLRELRQLNISGARVQSLAPLAACRKLTGISADLCKELRSLDGLEGCAALTYVDVNLSGVRDLSALAGAKQLEHLNARGTAIRDLSPILGARGLTRLFVEKTQVASIAGIERLGKLEMLWIWDTRVKDLVALTGMTSLRWLDVPGLRSSSWDFLGTLTGLEHLDLMGCAVPADLAGLLARLPKLTRVRLAKTPVDRDAPELKKLDARLRKRKGGVSFSGSHHWELELG
jgi:internalin A